MLGHGAIKAPWPNLLYPASAGNSGLRPEALGSLEPSGSSVQPDVAQQALVELGQLASRAGEFGAGHDVVDPDHDRTGQQRHGAAESEGRGFRAGDFPHAGQGRHDLAPFEATGNRRVSLSLVSAAYLGYNVSVFKG